MTTHISAPRTIDEAVSILQETHASGVGVNFRGGGTDYGAGYPPERADVLLRTTLLDRIVDHAPADLVVEVEAGTTLAALQAALEPHGQRLALDPPEPERATIGGLLATNRFGPRRTRFGSLRDLIVGMSLVRADGERVRGGGKVVKNVAGFDLPKIAVGSLGTLGLIATATFRLHPIPEATRSVCVAGLDAPRVRALVRAMYAARLEPVAAIARFERTAGSYALYATFEGFPTGVAEQIGRFAYVAQTLACASDEVEANVPFVVDRDVRGTGDLRIRASVPPADFETLHRMVVEPFARSLSHGDVVAYPTLGIAFASGSAAGSVVSDVASAVLAMRRGCEAIGGNLVTVAVDDATLARAIDPYGTLPAAYPIMRRLKDRFDPAHRLNRGRFVGKL